MVLTFEADKNIVDAVKRSEDSFKKTQSFRTQRGSLFKFVKKSRSQHKMPSKQPETPSRRNEERKCKKVQRTRLQDLQYVNTESRCNDRKQESEAVEWVL